MHVQVWDYVRDGYVHRLVQSQDRWQIGGGACAWWPWDWQLISRRKSLLQVLELMVELPVC